MPVQWIREQFEKAGREIAILGISGGIDSAVVYALTLEALGKENVVPIHIFKDLDDSYTRAMELCRNFGQQCLIFPLPEILNEIESNFLYYPGAESEIRSNALPEHRRRIMMGNVASRTRMLILYMYAEAYKGLVVGTINKTEYLLSYFTKWGDGSSDLEPIRDYKKGEVYDLARSYPQIPNSIFEAPSPAILWEGQIDEEELGYSCLEIDTKISLGEFFEFRKVNAHKRNPIPYFQRQ